MRRREGAGQAKAIESERTDPKGENGRQKVKKKKKMNRRRKHTGNMIDS